MEKWLPVLATVVAGGLVALQAPINSTLGKSVGTFAAASVSFAIGLAVLVAITLVAGGGFGERLERGRPALVLPHRRPARGRLRDHRARSRCASWGRAGSPRPRSPAS